MSPHALNKQKAQRVQYGVFPLCNIHCMLSYEMVLILPLSCTSFERRTGAFACTSLLPYGCPRCDGLPHGWCRDGGRILVQRLRSFEAIPPNAPMTMGLPMALTNQGWERTCSSMTSGC